mmetsp:Transcript_15293/g.35253  ORF Transcript_15293/g.35253 Transcript_15293/m.35253 type:complete len:281 (-) Transcript_15293:1578-2420(-)
MSNKSACKTTTTAKRKTGGDSNDESVSKKSKIGKAKKSSVKDTKNSQSTDIAKGDFRMLDLKDIRDKLEALCERVPVIPEGNFVIGNNEKNGEPIIDENATREWAAQLQIVLEEFNLYVCCVGTATYKWGTERTGAADQNLTLLLSEMSSSQEQISTTVAPRLTNLLAPVVDLVIEKTVSYQQKRTNDNCNKEGSTDTNADPDADTDNEKNSSTVEVKENHFTQKVVDLSFLSLCHKILARNAPLLRHVVLSNFHKLLRAMKDFLKAQENDQQHSRSFTY